MKVKARRLPSAITPSALFFSTEFKRYTGTTAMEYRVKNLEKAAS